MNFSFTKEEEAIRQELIDFLSKEVTPEVVAQQKKFYFGFNMWDPITSKIIKKIGERGWLVPHWPKEYGGLGSSHKLTLLIHDEIAYFRLPALFNAALLCAPIIMKEGSKEIKEEFLRPIARGEIEFAMGYSEPEAGSDLAALQLRAVDKGDYFLLNGQKIFSSAARCAKYHFLAARTDWENPKKHQGISLFIVDLSSPGITISPMETMGDSSSNEVFYDDVKVPKKYLVGQLNHGFYYLMSSLDMERLYDIGWWRRLFDDLLEYTKQEKRNGEPLGENVLVRQKLAQLATEVEVARLLYYHVACILDKGGVPTTEASMEKLFVSELAQRISNVGMQIMGLYGQLKGESKLAPAGGDIELHYRRTVGDTIGAGTSEIQKILIAQRGLGLPRA